MKVILKESSTVDNIHNTTYDTWYQGRIEYSGADEDVLALRLNDEEVLIFYKDGDKEVLEVSNIASGEVNLFKVDVEIKAI